MHRKAHPISHRYTDNPPDAQPPVDSTLSSPSETTHPSTPKTQQTKSERIIQKDLDRMHDNRLEEEINQTIYDPGHQPHPSPVAESDDENWQCLQTNRPAVEQVGKRDFYKPKDSGQCNRKGNLSK